MTDTDTILNRLASHKKTVSVIVFFVLSASCALAFSWYKTLYHFKTVDAGKLYRSGTLSRFGLEMAHSLYGFKTILNLRADTELGEAKWYRGERDFAEKHGLTLFGIPMLPDNPPKPEQIEQFLAIVNDPHNLPVFVHCEAGVVRTGMMVAVYNIAVLGQPNEKVLAELPMFGHTFENRPWVVDFILNYHGGREHKMTHPDPSQNG